jgi:hypothetical protein
MEITAVGSFETTDLDTDFDSEFSEWNGRRVEVAKKEESFSQNIYRPNPEARSENLAIQSFMSRPSSAEVSVSGNYDEQTGTSVGGKITVNWDFGGESEEKDSNKSDRSDDMRQDRDSRDRCDHDSRD